MFNLTKLYILILSTFSTEKEQLLFVASSKCINGNYSNQQRILQDVFSLFFK